ncbi:MAG: hypothetical protein PXZ07_09685 [Candidatus Eremiobacteraeota bacterium]|nr:hypothetical protein [Candidatus Eremiobacteraeota bacterium]
MLAFGLLGAVGAHALVFGHGHQLGGTLHGELIDLLFAAAAFAALVVVAKALCGDRHCADGTAIAAALRSALPSIPATVLTAGSWFAAIESCERAHAMPMLAIALAIVAVCAVLIGGARLGVRALRAARLFFLGILSTHASPTARPRRRAPQRLRARSVALRRHLFSRPPPVTA